MSEIASSLISGAFGLLNRRSVPKPMTADQMREYQETVYPNVTPWERLGAQGGGVPSAVASQDQAKIQAQVQRQQHKNQMQIAGLQAATNIGVANINAQNKLDVVKATQPVTSQITSPLIAGAKSLLGKYSYGKQLAKDFIKDFNASREGSSDKKKEGKKSSSKKYDPEYFEQVYRLNSAMRNTKLSFKKGIPKPFNSKNLLNPSFRIPTDNELSLKDYMSILNN
jgi:hypothetical protein